MSKDNRMLTILKTVKAHLGVGNLEFADQVLQGHIDALDLEDDAGKRRDKEKHGDVRVGHSHSKVDVSQAHCHRAGKTETRMLPMVLDTETRQQERIQEA